MLEGANKRPVEIVGLVESNIVGSGWGRVVEIDRVECVPRGEVTRCIGVRGWDIFSVEVLNKGNLIQDDSARCRVCECDAGEGRDSWLMFNVEVFADVGNEGVK